MSAVQNNMESPRSQPDPQHLLNELDAINVDEKKFVHLRNIFLEVADVDEYIQFLDTDEEIDLTRRQIKILKTVLEGFKVYLMNYLKRTGKSIEKFDERFKKNVEALSDPNLSPEEVSELARKRVGFSKAIKAVIAPRGAKGKNLRAVTQKGPVSGVENKKGLLSSEKVDEYLSEFKNRFDEFLQVHVLHSEWADVEKSLRADPEAIAKLYALDEKGHKMNVFSDKNGEFKFVSMWDNCYEVSEKHRNIVFDKEAQDLLAKKFPYKKCNGNATDLAEELGVDLADPNIYEELREEIKSNGWAWLKTDAAIRKRGVAFVGNPYGVGEDRVSEGDIKGSFRASLRVKKV